MKKCRALCQTLSIYQTKTIKITHGDKLVHLYIVKRYETNRKIKTCTKIGVFVMQNQSNGILSI